MLRMICRSAAILLCLLASLAPPSFSAERPPADYIDPITGMEFVAIPEGTFVFGNNQAEWAPPEQEVSVAPFLLGRYEVTFDQYAKFCASTGRILPADKGWGMGNRPVIGVTWDDAVAFTKWLSEQTGRTFRLPTEIEWEHAARGGVKTTYPWDETATSPPYANCRNCGSEWDGKMTAPVGSFASNGYGLYDVVGNVFEWCLDGTHAGDIGKPGEDILKSSISGEPPMRIQRSSSYLEPLKSWALSRRYKDRPSAVEPEYGFRVLLEP